MSFIICQERDKNGHICGETSNSSLKIVNEVKKIYEDRLKRIDQEAGCGDGIQLKLETMQSWIEDLEKQNAWLVQVVEQLEHEAEERIFVPAPHTSRSQIDKIKELEEEVEKLRRNVTELKSDREKLKNILESADISIKELEYKEHDSKIKLETMRTNLSSKEQVATNLEEMVKILQDSLNVAQKEKEELNINLRQCNADRCDLEHAQSKIKSLQEENKDLRTERTELLKTIKEQVKERRVVCPNKAQKVSDRSSAEESDYENEASGSEGQKTRVSSKGDWYINQLVELVDAQNDKIIYFEDNVTKLKINYNAVTERNKILEAEMDTLKQELEDYRQHTDESEARTSKSQAQADDCHTTMDFLQEKISVLKDLLREKSDNVNLLQADNEALQNELTHAQLDYEELEERSNRELDNLRKDLNKLAERLRNYECENQNLIEDEKKHQKMLLEAANREIKVQQDCTQRNCFLQNKLHKQESSNRKRLSLLQNKIAQCEKQKLILEREVTCTREAIRELSEICDSKTNYLKNFKIQLLEVPVCQDEVCSKSSKTVKTVGACLKELCKDNKNLKNGIRERDEIINKLMQKEKEQEELLRKARKQIAILLKALKSSKRRESGLLEKLSPVTAAEHPLDHRISSSVWDRELLEILDETSDIDNENVLNLEEAEWCYCSNLHQV